MSLETYQGMPDGWIRQIIHAGESAFTRRAFNPSPRCMGHFWDNVNKKTVHVPMGFVNVRPVLTFRPAPTSAVVSDDKPETVLLWDLWGQPEEQKRSCSASTTATKRHNCRFS